MLWFSYTYLILMLAARVAASRSMGPGNVLLAPLALPVILGPLSLVTGGRLRRLMAGSSLADLVVLTIFQLVLFMGAFSQELSSKLLGLGVAAAAWLVFYLAVIGPSNLPRWVESVLPVRGLHARRLIAAIAVLAIPAPGWPVLRGMAELFLGSWKQDEYSQALFSVFVAGYAILYFLPLWDVLARGWHPKMAEP